LDRRFVADVLATIQQTDPARATELELLYGIRKWLEYETGMILIGVILLVILGSLAVQFLSRLV